MKLHVYVYLGTGETLLVCGETEKERLQNLKDYFLEGSNKDDEEVFFDKEEFVEQDASVLDTNSGKKVFEIDIS